MSYESSHAHLLDELDRLRVALEHYVTDGRSESHTLDETTDGPVDDPTALSMTVPDDVRDRLRAEFDIADEIDDPEVEGALQEAIDRLLAGDEEGAATLLSERFTTPCAATAPERTVHSEGHESSCLRHRSEHAVAADRADD